MIQACLQNIQFGDKEVRDMDEMKWMQKCSVAVWVRQVMFARACHVVAR